MNSPFGLEQDSPVLRVHQLTVNYQKTPVLWDLTFQIPHGMTAIVGPNGAGKSTLIKTINGLLKPVSGHVSFSGKSLSEIRNKIAYVPQKESVNWDFPITAQELVLMGRYGKIGFLRWPSKKDRLFAQSCLEKVGMLDFSSRQISQLSGGQQQRVFLARAFAQEPLYFFLDEPFAGVDATTEKILVQLLREKAKEGCSIFVVHHTLETVPEYFDYTILLNTRLVAYGPTARVFTSENLQLAYGQVGNLFGEATKMSQDSSSGII